jgi:Ice-binding-like
MRVTNSLSFLLSASAAIALLAGCSGTNGAGTGGLSPAVQTAGVQGLTKLISQPCLMNPSAANTPPAVPLASAGTYGVLGGSTVTSAGLTVITGDLGVSPGTAYTGFPPGIVNGNIHAGDPVAAKAEADLGIAYNNAVARKHSVALAADIGGSTVTPGVYNAPTTLGISGTLTLDGKNQPNGVFIFQIPSTLTTAVNSAVVLTNGASACNVFWQVGSSATLNTASTFVGTIMAQASVSVGTGSTVTGRILAETGAVTLLDNAITVPFQGSMPKRQ